MQQKKPVAFFDIDGTVFRSSLLIEVVEACIVKGIFPQDARTSYQKEFELWLNREGTYDSYIGAVVKSFLLHLEGVNFDIFQNIGQEVVDVLGKQTYRYTRDLIKELYEDGYHLVAISQSPKVILDVFCKHLGFHKVYGRIYTIDNTGNFTGEIEHLELIADKSNIIERVFNHDEFTKEGSIGVGDTEGDISLLDAVEKPICFNPNKLLYEYALEKHWQVIVERKDVIYHL